MLSASENMAAAWRGYKLAKAACRKKAASKISGCLLAHSLAAWLETAWQPANENQCVEQCHLCNVLVTYCRECLKAK